MAVGDAHVFPGFLTPILTQLSFQSQRLLSLHASEARAGQNVRFKWVSNSQPPGQNQTNSPVTHPGGTNKDCKFSNVKPFSIWCSLYENVSPSNSENVDHGSRHQQQNLFIWNNDMYIQLERNPYLFLTDNRCVKLPHPPHGQVRKNDNLTVNYSCNKGFILIGPSKRHCQENGRWSGKEPRCEAGNVK